jgi:NADH dehydrogenase
MVEAGVHAAEGVLVLGAGYAGVTLSHAVRKAGRGKVPLRLVDRHPSHTLRTRLYEVGKIAEAQGRPDRWSVPIDQVLAHDRAQFVEGSVRSIDLERRTVTLEDQTLAFRSLAICLGSEAAYYGIPGAAEHTEQVYRFAGAVRVADRLQALLRKGEGSQPTPVRVIVVGGGSTGTELASEIATADWPRIVARPTAKIEVTMVVGSVPFLAGLPPNLIRHAAELLQRAGVRTIPGLNVRKVESGRLTLQDGSILEADLIVWCAGLEAPEVVRSLKAEHGKGGRLVVSENLELPGHPGIFAVGDVIEFKDPRTGVLVPGTAQAALAEAPVAGRNAVAYLRRQPYASFVYRERGTVVEVGRHRASASLGGLSLWGRPAALLKQVVDQEYRTAAEGGRGSSVL